MKDKLATLKHYDGMIEAMFDQELLKENNIRSFINNQQLVELYPMFGDIDEGLKLVVFEKDREKALRVIAEYTKSLGSE
ncbi:MAG: DUF2007 domain-containing protein [Prevotellaceae bacterium]|jgi:hypothetical protein|nr:DUF2007 domain-containing protein [Prevotellaceae bacterium]